MRHSNRIALFLLAATALRPAPSRAQSIDTVPVVARPLARTVELPGELTPFLNVLIHARVAGYVEQVLVDRGSAVRKGQILAVLSAPELQAQLLEMKARTEAAKAENLQAEARLRAAESTYSRMKKAAGTPGAIAANELVQYEQEVEAAKALVAAKRQSSEAAQASWNALQATEAYLKVTAPFDGVITDRLVHPGALVGPGAENEGMLQLQQLSRLRLTVAIPEQYAGNTVAGGTVEFGVRAFPGKTFKGLVRRISHSVDSKTRTMSVELDVANFRLALAPGMYAAVQWPVERKAPALLVPKTSVVTTSERTFVIRSRNRNLEWVDVQKGATDGDLIEVRGELKPGDQVVRRGTDELRNGMRLP